MLEKLLGLNRQQTEKLKEIAKTEGCSTINEWVKNVVLECIQAHDELVKEIFEPYHILVEYGKDSLAGIREDIKPYYQAYYNRFLN